MATKPKTIPEVDEADPIGYYENECGTGMPAHRKDYGAGDIVIGGLVLLLVLLMASTCTFVAFKAAALHGKPENEAKYQGKDLEPSSYFMNSSGGYKKD